jgi:hypothetical protein
VPKVLSVLTLLPHISAGTSAQRKTDDCQDTTLYQYTGDKTVIDKTSSLLGHDRNEQLVLLWTE